MGYKMNDYLNLLTTLIALGCSLILLAESIFCYMNDGVITINIDKYGEHLLDIILFSICSIICVVNTLRYIGGKNEKI